MTPTEIALILITAGAVCAAVAGWWRAWHWKRTAEMYRHDLLWERRRRQAGNGAQRPRYVVEDE